MRSLADQSLSVFRRWSSTREIANYQRALPAEVYFVGQIAAYRVEDGGSSLQIVTHNAKKAGVAPELIRAALLGRVKDLPHHLQRVYRFGQREPHRIHDPELRRWIVDQYGRQGLIELVTGIAGGRTLPHARTSAEFVPVAPELPVKV